MITRCQISYVYWTCILEPLLHVTLLSLGSFYVDCCSLFSCIVALHTSQTDCVIYITASSTELVSRLTSHVARVFKSSFGVFFVFFLTGYHACLMSESS